MATTITINGIVGVARKDLIEDISLMHSPNCGITLSL